MWGTLDPDRHPFCMCLVLWKLRAVIDQFQLFFFSLSGPFEISLSMTLYSFGSRMMTTYDGDRIRHLALTSDLFEVGCFKFLVRLKRVAADNDLPQTASLLCPFLARSSTRCRHDGDC